MHFLIRKFWKSFSDFISDFIVAAESSYNKDFWKANGKFVENIPGWGDACLKSSLVCGFKDMGWRRISSIDMGEGCCYIAIGEM